MDFFLGIGAIALIAACLWAPYLVPTGDRARRPAPGGGEGLPVSALDPRDAARARVEPLKFQVGERPVAR